MNISQIEKGMKIRVGLNLSNTERRFTTVPDMRSLKGEVCIVEHVDYVGERVIFNSFVWDSRDLMPIDVTKKVKRIKPVTFDPSHLDL